MDLEDLPEGVILTILSKLAVPSILQLGATSKKWKSIVGMVEIPDLKPWCVVTPRGFQEDYEAGRPSPLVYDLEEKAWHEWVLPYPLLSSSRGYLLLESVRDFVLAKPHKMDLLHRIPKSSATLDEYDGSSPLATLIVEKEEAGCVPRFKIVEPRRVSTNYWCLKEFPEASKFSLYNSFTSLWTTNHEFKPRLCLPAGRPLNLRGSLYYLTKVRASTVAELQKNEFLYRLVAYSLKTPKSRVIMSRFPGRFQFVYMFSYHGRRMLFGAIWNSLSKDGERYLRTCVWQLEEKKMAWVEVMRLPRKQFREYCKKTDPWEYALDNDRFSDKTRCANSGDYLCVFDNSTTSRLLVCNLMRKSWSVEILHESIRNRHGGLELHMVNPWLHVPLSDIAAHRSSPRALFPCLSAGDPGMKATLR